MMIAPPAIVGAEGTSPNTRYPNITAHTIIAYWYGTTTLAGASFSERLVQSSATIEMHPASTNRPRSGSPGARHANGASTRPTLNVPVNCVAASTISGVARSERVTIISTAKEKLPASAISAGHDTVCADGCKAINTPQKPTTTALQRRQPTFSRRMIAESAVTKIGHAR